MVSAMLLGALAWYKQAPVDTQPHSGAAYLQETPAEAVAIEWNRHVDH